MTHFESTLSRAAVHLLPYILFVLSSCVSLNLSFKRTSKPIHTHRSPTWSSETVSSPSLLLFSPVPSPLSTAADLPHRLGLPPSIYHTLVMPMRALVLLSDEVLVVGALCSVLVCNTGIDLQAQPKEHHAVCVWVTQEEK